MYLSDSAEHAPGGPIESPGRGRGEFPASPFQILTPVHSFESGGVERVAIRLTNAWRSLGIDARLAVGRARGATSLEYQDLAFDRLGPDWVPTARWETLWMIMRLPRLITQIQPDVLFCAGNTYSIVAIAMRLYFRRRCPFLLAKISNDLVRHDLDPLSRRAYHFWLRFQARRIDAFVALSPAMRQEIHRIMKVDLDRITVIGDPALTTHEITPLEPPHERPGRRDAVRYLLVGRLVKQKNIRLALASFADIRRHGDSLTVVGDGPERSRLTRYARRLGIDSQVCFVGYSSDVFGWLRWADVLVLPSDYEGLPAVVIEAMAAGKPVVATDCTSSIHDLLGDGRFGVVVPRNDAIAFGDAMRDAVRRPFDAPGARQAALRHTLEYGSRAYLQALRRQLKVTEIPPA